VLVEYDRVWFCPEKERLITRYFSNKNAKILDIGCGLGRTTQPLSDMGFEVIGIDVSEAMINKARAKFPTIDFRIGDAYDLPFRDEAFEYTLFSFNGIDHIHPERRRIQALREIHRVLKPGGLFLFSSHNSWSIDVVGGLLSKDILWRSVLSKYLLRSQNLKSKTRDGEFALYFINPINQKSNYGERDLNVNILLPLTGKRVAISILCHTMSRKRQVFRCYLVEPLLWTGVCS
jgi:ubiquinone/menaquinone biosynthesis C-methylase UbiE